MPLYRFKVINPTGTQQEISIEEQSQDLAMARLRMQKMVYLDYIGEGQQKGSRSIKGSRLNVEEFTERLSALLSAGIELADRSSP